jgi:hypothetical protein
MTQESSRDVRAAGYVMVFTGVLVAAQAVDRIFFHKTFGLRWLTATVALASLAGGTWMIIKRRRPLGYLDDLAKERWGWLGNVDGNGGLCGSRGGEHLGAISIKLVAAFHRLRTLGSP